MKRFGSVMGLRPEGVAEYKRLHVEVWPDVLAQISRSNLRNYSVFFKEPESLLFAYYEYVGTDYEADMAAMMADPATQEWWKVVTPLQTPFKTRKPGEWWAEMPEVFHVD